jgi:hypothetical protein
MQIKTTLKFLSPQTEWQSPRTQTTGAAEDAGIKEPSNAARDLWFSALDFQWTPLCGSSWSEFVPKWRCEDMWSVAPAGHLEGTIYEERTLGSDRSHCALLSDFQPP